MEEKNNNLGRHGHAFNSVDGIINRQHLQKPKQPDHSLSNLPAREDTIPPMSAHEPKKTNEGSSLLNLNLASSSSLNERHLKTRKHIPWKKYLLRSTLAVIAVFLLVGGWLGYKAYRNIAKITHNNNPFAAIASALDQVNLKSQGDWVNVLVAGYDPSDGDITTDTIDVLSVNKLTHQAIMLSVPRDMWVNNLPGFGHQKINASNDISSFNESGYPKGGMGELEQQIHDKLGITCDYYALVNNQAYVDGVNAVGGIDVDIQSPDPRGLYDPNVDKENGGPLNLTNGWHHLDGLQALALVKARGDSAYSYGFPNSDFDREAHARQVILAMKDKALTTGIATNPLDISKLLDTIGNNVQTDITLSDVSGFYHLVKDVKDSNVKSFSVDNINGQQLLQGDTIDGLDVEIPTAGIDDYSQIQNVVSRLYSSNPVYQEAATVVILNGSNVDGLAKQQETNLTNDGFVVIQIGDPNSVYSGSMVIDQSHGKDPASAAELKKIYSTDTSYTTSLNSAEANEAKNYYSADFVIVLGQNWDSTSASSSATQ